VVVAAFLSQPQAFPKSFQSVAAFRLADAGHYKRCSMDKYQNQKVS
jgi:hypothetical protein